MQCSVELYKRCYIIIKQKILSISVMHGNSNAPSLENSVQSLLSVESSRQMKQAAFEMIVRQDAVEERANQLRWWDCFTANFNFTTPTVESVAQILCISFSMHTHNIISY